MKETAAKTTLSLAKGAERYIFIFDEASRVEAIRTFGRFASRQDLSFTWYDAALLSQRVRAAADSQSSRTDH